MITPLVLALSAFLSVTWGVYLAYTVADYRRVHRLPRADRVRNELVAAFRRVLVAACCWTISFAYVFRTVCVLAGVGEATVGEVTFFALAGVNVVGSLFAMTSVVDEFRGRGDDRH